MIRSSKFWVVSGTFHTFSIFIPESVSLLGFTGHVCGTKPTWVQELRKPFMNLDAKPVTIETEITVSSIYC